MKSIISFFKFTPDRGRRDQAFGGEPFPAILVI